MRFLGRKVYLGALVVLVMAMEHGLSAKRRKQLIEQLDLYPQTLARWRRWWRKIFPASRCWQANRGQFIPPVDARRLPGELLGRLSGEDLVHRVCLLLQLLAPVTTACWSGSLRVVVNPQTM